MVQIYGPQARPYAYLEFRLVFSIFDIITAPTPLPTSLPISVYITVRLKIMSRKILHGRKSPCYNLMKPNSVVILCKRNTKMVLFRAETVKIESSSLYDSLASVL